jgi:hypothetical protein
MNPKPRMTKQGLRDLNHYGPKPGKDAAEASLQANGVDGEAAPPISDKAPEAPLSVDE